MEEENRDQKVKAAKEKLAQFQRKKRKKKTCHDENNSSSAQVAQLATTTSPPEDSFSDPQLFMDSDTLTISSCSEDDTDSGQELSSQAQLRLKSKLQERSQRVEELEESLVGKQLALDKVIKENEKLKTLIHHVDHSEQSDANHNPVGNMAENQNQSCCTNGAVESQSRETCSRTSLENEAGTQEFTISDVQELMHHLQWLQLQLKQANNTLQMQNEKQKETAGALCHAKEEINLLQNSIIHKDKLLNELVEKMKLVTTEYGLLKQNYACMSESSNENLAKEVEKEKKMTAEIENALKSELEGVKSEHECKIQELVESHKKRLAMVTEEYELKIKDLESQLIEIRTKNEENEISLEKMTNENTGLQSYCDTLTKGLEFLKEEHEKAVIELNELSGGFKILKSEYDNLVEEKGLSELQVESLTVELDHVKTERESLLVEIDRLKNENDKFINDTKGIYEKLENITVENQKLLQDNTALADELVKLKGDNATYQSQIAEYEGKLSESEEILDENHSLHVLNDELNNKINNQKDVIATLKNELEVLTLENSQYVGQVEVLSNGLQQVKTENIDLNGKNENLLKEVTQLKDKILLLEEENLQNRDNQLVLNEEIQNLRQCLAESSPEPSAKVPVQVTNVLKLNQPLDTVKEVKYPVPEELKIVNEEMIVAQESKSRSEAAPHVFTSQRDDEVENEYSDIGRSFKKKKQSIDLSDYESKIVEYEHKIEHLNNVIIEIQASKFSNEVVEGAKQVLKSDLSSETGDESDKMSAAATNIDDTAYESLFGDHAHVEPAYSNSDVDILAERLQNIQQELNTVNQMLQHKTKECEELQQELHSAKQKLLQDKPESSDGSEGALNDNDNIETVSKQTKVSETCSVTCLEKEVNMHASSSLCSVPNDGVVTIDSSLPGIICKGDSDFYVDQDTFQNVNEDRMGMGSHSSDQQEVCCDMEGLRSETDNGIHENLSRELAELKEHLMIKEMEVMNCKDTLEQMSNKNSDLNTCVENLEREQELLRTELESKDKIISKLRKDQENLDTVCEQLRVRMKNTDEILTEREKQVNELTYENEKLLWERDEMSQSLTDTEKQVLDMKTAKCDIEFQKMQYEDELNRVKERLEYLKSSDIDIMEIKDMLEKVQEEKENILRENENLNGSLSAQIEENEKLLETMQCLQKENASYLERFKVSTIELDDVSNELRERKLAVESLEEKVKILTNEMQSQHLRFEGEIEGLLEENSTLKTNVQMKIDECEILKNDNERLQSFFPNIDEENGNNNLLKTKVNELEDIVKELKFENENLVAELMESQNKVLEGAEENELLLDKCEEFQRIISELDDEKTLLIEDVERIRQETSTKLQESNAVMEKYENQLESLDQENSTLKTQILSLHQEKDENEIDNHDYKEKMIALEQDLLSLGEQVKQYENTIVEKEDISLRLGAHIEELLKENTHLKDKCDSLETDYHDVKEREAYLKEQMKIYECALNSGEEGSRQEIKVLSSRLELESKYKAKFEKDLEHSQNCLAQIEEENKKMKERNTMLEKELKVAIDSRKESEKDKEKLSCEVDKTLGEKQILVKEKSELRNTLSEVSKSNEMLKSEISTLQHHLQAISDNRTHIRNQVEILAAEVENLNDTNNSMNAHIMELNSWQSFKHKECEELIEDKSELTEENAKLKNKLETLQTEIENSRIGATEPEHSQHININDMEQELIELHSENESLVDEINELQDKLNEKEEVIKALNETVDENEAIRSENEDLQQQNNVLQSHFQSLREKLTQLDELIEKNKAAEVDNDALGERLDVLQKRIVEIQKEKQALQTMTDDLTNMLHDMQTKYEEVKSEMESTKKKCDKEINHLQNQLHEMNEDVSELRKMLDYMENEMYSHAEEKTILKENLEQQQSQFVEVCEQKQKLEEILSEKQQKDLKNMQMASQRQKNNSLNTSRSETDIPCSVNMTMDDNQSQCEQDLPCNDQNDNESQTEIREMNTQPMEEVLRDSTDSDFSDIIPSFESAFHLFGLASSDESASVSRMVQTNITIRSCDDVGFLLDDDEEKTKNDQVLVKIDIETQTDIVKTFNELEVFPNIDIPGNDSVMVSQDLRNETVNMEVCDSERVIESDIFFQTKDFASSETGEESDTTGKGHAFSQICDTTVNKCDTASQVDFEVESISCQTVTQQVQNSENQRLLSLDIDNEDMSETISANFSILSADSGIQSACPGADGSNIPFQYPDRNNMKTIEDSNTEFKNDDIVDGIEVNNSVAKLECVEESSQTDRGFESELESAIAEVKEQLKIEFNEKSVELEAEIESRVLTNLDSREQNVHLLEESYDRKIKQMEYEIEEKYEQKFRMREVEIAFEAERDIKAQATKAKNAAEIEIEKIKREKDQQFVVTLQKVKADLNKRQRKESGDMRRAVSYDSSSERRDQEIGPEGDATQMLDGTFQKFAEDQEEIALERDTLLKQIKVTQAEQEVLCQQLQSIMGEHSNMGNDKQTKQEQDQSWLDWDLHPELSFGSMRSSMDTKSLSGSLDPSSFCSNSDCLNVRMKYEHLVDKIQQFLRSRTLQEPSDSAGPVERIPIDGDDDDDDDDDISNNGAKYNDRFEENDEHESQMLHRITSIDLETFVRVPKPADAAKSGDQFVYEADDINDDTTSTLDLDRDVIDRLVRGESNSSENERYNAEGRFSENEDSDDDSDSDIIERNSVVKLNQSRSSASFAEEGGLFCQEGESHVLLRKKRHFSDSDIRFDGKSVQMTMSQSVNNEGRFVLERLDSQVEKHNFGKEEIYTDQSGEKNSNEDSVFEEMEVRNVSKLASETKSNTEKPYLKKSEKDVDKFIDESNDNQPPGTQEVVMGASCEPRTGEETGDFFEEKIVRSVVLSSKAKNSQDTVAMSVSPRSELRNTEQNLESDLSTVKEYKNGQQSYENTVFDILNSICPGTDPGRRPGANVVIEDTFQPVLKEFENKTDELNESPSSSESNLQTLKADLRHMKLELRSLTNENRVLKDTIKSKEIEAEKDAEVLVEKISELEETNRETVLGMENAYKKLTNYEQVARKYNDLEKMNKELFDELEHCRELLLHHESDVKTKQDLCEKLETIEIELECKRSDNTELQRKYCEMETKCIKMEKLSNEIALEKSEILAKNGKLLSDFEMFKDVQEKLKSENANLIHEKSELEEEKEILKSRSENNASLIENQEELKKKITEVQSEKEMLEVEFEKKADLIFKEKDELEKSLLAQADMYDRKEEEIKELKKDLHDLERENEIFKEKYEIELNENKNLKDDLEREISSKKELILKGEKMSEDFTEMKLELDTQCTSLNSEIKNLKAVVENSESRLDELKHEKEELNYLIQKSEVLMEEKDNQIQEKDKTITSLNSSNQELIHKVEKLQVDTMSLQSVVDEMTAKINEMTKENEILQDIEKESTGLKEMNESLNDELMKVKEINKENEWAISELSEQIECLEKEKMVENDIVQTSMIANNRTDFVTGANRLPEKKLTKDTFSNTNSYVDVEREINKLNETIEALRIENESLKGNVKKNLSDKNIKLETGTLDIENVEQINSEVTSAENIEQKLEASKIENEALNQTSNKFSCAENIVQKLDASKLESEVLNQIGKDASSDEKIIHELESLKLENGTLKFSIENIKQELDALKLENETLKRSLEFAMVKDESDTDLQIFEDMKDAIKSMETERTSVEKHEKEMSDNMVHENKRLRDEIEELYSENDDLKKRLKIQEESARKENGEILKMYSDLRNEVEILVISKHDLEVELHALKDLLEHDANPVFEKTEYDSSRELTVEDLEEMEELKTSIEKLKSDLKEKDTYVKKLEEHLLNLDGNIPDLNVTPKPSMSRGTPLMSKSYLRRGHNWSLSSNRRAYSHDGPTINIDKDVNRNKPDLERSQTLDTSLHVDDLDGSRNSERQFCQGLKAKEKLTSSTLTDSLGRSSFRGSVDESERIRSGLKPDEDGHLALELKQFELVAEITKLRRDFRETKALYSKETALLTEALEKEKIANELRGMHDLSFEHNVGSNLSHDVLKLRKEVARLREQNRILSLDCDMWIERLKEQEHIVADMKERINQNTSGYGEIEEVFGRQLALLQKQREELIDKLKERERENFSLSETIGEKGILEETLRKEKDVLVAKLKEKEKIEKELSDKKVLLEKQAAKQKELEDIVYQKDINEIELMKQKRILEENLREIESRFRDKEENLDFEKNKLLNELREKRTKDVRSRFSESDDDVSSVCSESAAFSDRNIGRLEIMLEQVEKQHSVAVNVLRDQLRIKYNKKEKELRKEHLVGLERLKQDSRNQVNK